MEKTEETREIMDVTNILLTFMRHGIYRFKFEDITNAYPFGILADLKLETFGRWLRNPFYQYIPSINSWQFLYGKKPPFLGKADKELFGLDDAIISMGEENFVRWLRIWSTGYAEGTKSDPEAILRLENDITAIYNRGIEKTRLEGRKAANKEALKAMRDIWERACALKGRPDYLSMPVHTGRKATVMISRNTKNANKKTFIAEPYFLNGGQDLVVQHD